MKKRRIICRIIILAEALILAFLFFGCGGKEVKPGVYYVRLNPSGLGINDKPKYEKYTNLVEAKAYADENAIYGSIVTDSNYDCIYAPYSEVSSEILYQAKIVCDFIRDAGFSYGNAPINPAFNYDALLVSCDRLVDWVLYRVGYTDQPYANGKCVSGPGLTNWCIDQGFSKISKLSDVKPGDIIFTRPNPNGDPLHTYICAGEVESDNLSYRYDAGSDKRIQSTQPSYEANTDFMYAYRVKVMPSEKGYVEKDPALLTKFDESVIYNSVFIDDFNDGTKNWRAANMVSGMDVRNGFLKLTSTGGDPYIIYNNDLDIDCGDVDCIRVRIKNGTYSDTFQIFLTTDTITNFCQELCFSAEMVGLNMDMNDDNWEELTIDLTKNTSLKGIIKKIRIDPVSAKGEFRIDFISLDKIG